MRLSQTLDYPRPARQQGVVLIVALIMLVAMTLGGIALVRSVYGTNIIAGNMAFQQAATNAGDIGIERAVKFLEVNSTLQFDALANGYSATNTNPVAGQSANDFWDALLAKSVVPVTIATDQNLTGNTVSYIIERLCGGTGASSDASCAIGPVAYSSRGANQDIIISPTTIPATYYRITSRVSGPHNTVSFVQAIVSM